MKRAALGTGFVGADFKDKILLKIKVSKALNSSNFGEANKAKANYHFSVIDRSAIMFSY